MKKFENMWNVIARRCFNTDVAISIIKECRDKESLFARVACFRRLPRLLLAMTPYRHSERSEESSKINIKTWILRFAFAPLRMTMLALVLSISVISESFATCNGATATTAGTDENGDYCGICNDSGTCKWKLASSGELNIYADGATNVVMKNYSYNDYKKEEYPFNYKSTAPWAGKGATSLMIGDGIKTIGASAFIGESKITSVNGMNSVTTLNDYAFDWMTGVTKLTLPNSMTTLNYLALTFMTSLTSLTIPNSVTNVSRFVFTGSAIKELIIPDDLNTKNWNNDAFNPSGEIIEPYYLKNFTIRCLGELEKCQTAFAKYLPAPQGYCTIRCLQGVVLAPATETQCNASGKYYFNGAGCIKRPANSMLISCENGYAKIKGNCVDPLKTFAKKRYTPAEAAQWLNEDNNTVTLTFKK